MPTAPKKNLKSPPGLSAGQVTPFPTPPGKTGPERIRPELNLEKWAIWQPAHSRNKETRTFRRVITDENRNERIQQVTVHYVDKVGTLTTEDQKTYYALVKHWEDSGRSTEWTFFSLRQLAKLLNKKWGTNVIESLTQSLTRLRTIGIVWTDAYFDGKTETVRDVLDPFTILSKVKIVRRRTDGHVTTAVGYFKFDDDILNNLLANYTKPVLLETVLRFKSELAQVLYTYLDLILHDKTLYERRTKELFEDLGLIGSAYMRAGKRKQALEPAVKELLGVTLTSGRIAAISLEETKDQKDYKIVVRKGKLVALPKINHYQQDQESGATTAAAASGSGEVATPDQVHLPQTAQDEIQQQATDLVTYFYQVFQSGNNFQITSRAIGQAISLITQYGLEMSKYIVDYAHREAPKTNFDIQTFGGVMQYSSRAFADFERRQIQQENAIRYRAEHQARLQQDLEQQRREQAAKDRAQAYLDQLPKDEYQALYDEYASQYKTSEFYRAHYNSLTVQSAIRTLMLRQVITQQETTTSRETASETTANSSNEPAKTETEQPNG